MEYLFQNAIVPYLKLRYSLTGIIKARVLHASGVGESQIDEWIGDLEKLSNPTVGLLAHPGVCDIRIAAKAASIEDADRMIAAMETTIRERCGETIFGADSESLASVIFKKLALQSWRLGAFECNLNGEIRTALGEAGLAPDLVLQDSGACSPDDLANQLASLAGQLQVEVVVGASLQPGPEKQSLSLAVLTPRGVEQSLRFYGGPPQYAVPWGVNSALDYLRRNL
jgi:hypothetical protein